MEPSAKVEKRSRFSFRIASSCDGEEFGFCAIGAERPVGVVGADHARIFRAGEAWAAVSVDQRERRQ